MNYIDGVVIAVPAMKQTEFLDHATRSAQVFKEHGATRVVEGWADDVTHGKLTDFYRAVKATDEETVVFSWIEWPDKATRDAAWQAIMKDPRLLAENNPMPFDGKRMIFGGFQAISDIQQKPMLQPIPYLAFDGNCAEAMRFYAKVLGGKLGMMTFAQSPFAEKCEREHLNRIMHARLELDGGVFLYAGDCPSHMPYNGIHGVSLAINYDTVAKAEEVFNALAEGGAITMPFSDTFWAKKFGMCTDKFGCHWIVNAELTDIKL
jgi:PhnB protein